MQKEIRELFGLYLSQFLISQLAKRMPILFRKVWFKSPLIQSKHAPASELPVHCDNEPFQTSSPVQHIKPEDDASNGGKMDPEEAHRSKVMLKRSITKTPERAKFFHFSSDSDEEAFFQRMRERCDKLWSIPFFPLTAENNELFILKKKWNLKLWGVLYIVKM